MVPGAGPAAASVPATVAAGPDGTTLPIPGRRLSAVPARSRPSEPHHAWPFITRSPATPPPEPVLAPAQHRTGEADPSALAGGPFSRGRRGLPPTLTPPRLSPG